MKHLRLFEEFEKEAMLENYQNKAKTLLAPYHKLAAKSRGKADIKKVDKIAYNRIDRESQFMVTLKDGTELVFFVDPDSMNVQYDVGGDNPQHIADEAAFKKVLGLK